MADRRNPVRRRGEAPERNDYRADLERLANFVDNELGNGGAPGPRPDTTEWRIQRAKTIEILNDLRRKLDSVCVGANYGKIAGNGASISGNALSIVGSLLSLGGVPAGPIITNVGNLVNHSGVLVDGVSNVIESTVSANYLNEVEKVLKKDKELSRPLLNWLNYSNELDENVEAIFGVSLTSAKWNTVMKVFYEFSKLSTSVKGFDATMNLMRQGRYSVYIGNDVKLDRLQKFFQELGARPEMAERIRVALSVLSASTGGIMVFRDGAQVYRSIMGTSGTVVPSLLGGQIPTVGAVLAFCVFETISMAINVLSLINAASIIRKGTSQYSDALKQLARSLAWELRQMEDL